MRLIRNWPANRTPELDGIRAIAIILVILFHYINNQLTFATHPALVLLRKVTSLGWSGVDLFFVLSGFLIGGILIRNKESKNYFKNFYLRRILRIFPLYYLLIFLFILVKSMHLGDETDRMFQHPIPIIHYILYIQNYVMGIHNNFGPQLLTPTWSLAVEEQFYLIFPAFIFFIQRKYIVHFLLALLIIAPVSRAFTSNWYQYYTWLPSRIDSLAFGALLAYFWESEKARLFFISNRKKVFYIFLILTILVVGINSTLHLGILNFSGLSLIYAIIILLAITGTNTKFSKLLCSGPLQVIGIISYGLYIFHQFVSHVLHKIILCQDPMLNNLSSLTVTLLALVVTIVISVISYNYFEYPILQKGHKYKY